MINQREALLALYKWATGQDKGRNPYSYKAVTDAREALQKGHVPPVERFDLPRRRPTGATARALYDLSKWSTSSDRRMNPYSYLPVRNANRALGGDGYNLPGDRRPSGLAAEHGALHARYADDTDAVGRIASRLARADDD
jgi:hypothetical protein